MLIIREAIHVYRGMEYMGNLCIFFLIFTCLFLTALGLCCCPRAFSSCSERVLLSNCGFSCCGSGALGTQTAVAVVLGLSSRTACEIVPDQGSKQCPLNYKVDS